MEPFIAESECNTPQTEQPLTFYHLRGVWQVLSNKLVGFNHILVDWRMSTLKIFPSAHQDDGEKKFKKIKIKKNPSLRWLLLPYIQDSGVFLPSSVECNGHQIISI